MARAGVAAALLWLLPLAAFGRAAVAPLTAGIRAEAEQPATSAAAPAAVLTGAIRWDAWFGAPAAPHEGIIGRATTKALTPAKFHYRLPFFAKIESNGSVVVNGDSAAVMAQENKFATEHGIDYYAFCTYPIGCADYSPPDSACVGAQCCADNYKLSYALQRYLASPEPKPRFSLILQAHSWYPGVNSGSNETLAQEADRYASYFALPSYQKVAGNRPLVFLLGGSSAVPHLPEALDLLRQRSTAAGLGEPFFFMMQNAPTAATLRQLVNHSAALGVHGLSQYNLVGNRTQAGFPYAENMRFEQGWWRDAAATGMSVVVPVSAGWDSRPRQESVMPWGDTGNKRCLDELGHECWLADPSMSELTEQTKAALEFASKLGAGSTAAGTLEGQGDSGGDDDAAAAVRSVLLSAWNENDEGHWIVPSLQDGPAKLEAVAKAITAHKQRRESYWAAATQQLKTDDDDSGKTPKKARFVEAADDDGGGGKQQWATASSAAVRPDVGAIYFGDWAPDPWMEALHGANWTEWQLPLNAQPRYPGHFQPNLPIDAKGWGPTHPESDPDNMAVKIDAAADHAIDFFMFDWYWYAETGGNPAPSKSGGRNPAPNGFPKTEAGGPFLEAALNAFVQAPNSKRLKFCLHFCNQDWVDVHPAKFGYHATGRPFDAEAAGGDVAPPTVRNELLMFDGWMTQKVYHAAFDHIARKFFTLDNYYTLPTKQADGTVKDCAVFAFYILGNMVSSMGEAATIESLQYLRNASQTHAGKCVHIQLMTPQVSLYPSLGKMGIDSTTDYCWMKLGLAKKFPETPYDDVLNAVVDKWDEREGELRNASSVPRYIPSVSTAWDSSPRTLIHDRFEPIGYPWGAAFHAEPMQFGQGLRLAKSWSQKRCATAEGCPPVIINAWNEWSEGAYLEPDQRYGFAKLEQVNATFAR